MLKSTTLLTLIILAFSYTHANSQGLPDLRTDQSEVIAPAAPLKKGVDVSTATKSSTGQPSNFAYTETDPTLNHEVFEDFMNGSNNTALERINQLAYAGGGTGQAWGYGPASDDAWGVIQAQHGTGPYSRLDLVGKSPNMHFLTLGTGTSYEYQVRFNFASLSTPDNRFITFDGFFDSYQVDPDFDVGVLFRYSDDINGGRFQAVVREAPGIETLVDTGVAPEIDVWYRLKIIVNAKGNQALFFINDNQVAAVETNLAVGPNKRYTAESNNDRLSGTTPFVSRRFDYVRFRAVSGRASRL